MFFSIGENTREAMETLEIKEFPFSAKLLKKNFSILLNAYHPDKNNGKGDKEKTRKIIEAYNILRNLSSENINIDEPKKKMKSDELFSLWEKCPECLGSGTVKRQRFNGYTKCNCDSPFTVYFRVIMCRSCGGSGRFKQKRGKIVTCRDCHGSGKISIKGCSECQGTGQKPSYINATIDCPKCGGLGEYERKPWNPVIPKGAILI